MKLYMKNRKLITINCDNCGVSFDKPISEYERNISLNRRNFCSRNCCGKRVDNIFHKPENRSNYNIAQHSNNRNDIYTPFKYLYDSCKRRYKYFSITLQDLKEQWELQNGICPYTNVKLQLPNQRNNIEYQFQASIDRIDSNLGYTKENIEFIALPINYLKSNRFTKEQTIQYLKQISNFH